MNKILFFLLLSYTSFGNLRVKQVLINGKFYRDFHNSTIHLGPGDEDLLIEFEPEKGDSVTYMYQLSEGGWYRTSYPVIHYSKPAGGIYKLRMRAAGEKVENTVTTLTINVKEAFWQKWWFWPLIVLYILLILGIGFFVFFMYDVRQKLRLQNMRNQIASDLHDEVGSNLSSIAIFVELLRKKAISQNPELLTLLDKITDNSEETVTLMRDTVWAINPSNDSTAKLIEKMHSFSAEILSAKGISFDFECLIDTTKDVFSMEQRRNLYLIYKEAINNIAKHAEATKASCLIKTEHDLILIVIRDNGRGFELNETFEGNGLKNFKMRSQGEELEVKVRSSPGSGSEIRIEIAV